MLPVREFQGAEPAVRLFLEERIGFLELSFDRLLMHELAIDEV